MRGPRSKRKWFRLLQVMAWAAILLGGLLMTGCAGVRVIPGQPEPLAPDYYQSSDNPMRG